MPLDKFSASLLASLNRAGKLDGTIDTDKVVKLAADNFMLLLAGGGSIKDLDIAIGKLQGDTPKIKGVLPIRMANGKMESAFSLKNLLTMKMRTIAKSNMGKGGRLKYQSGRLINSAWADVPIFDAKTNTLSLNFRYMFAPYEVFDPKADVVTDGGMMKSRLATNNRSPRRLFREALREAAKGIISAGYNLIVKQVGVTKR